MNILKRVSTSDEVYWKGLARSKREEELGALNLSGFGRGDAFWHPAKRNGNNSRRDTAKAAHWEEVHRETYGSTASMRD